MRYARIENNEVREIGIFDSIEGRFHPSLVWVGCGDAVVPGWTYDGSVFSPPPESPEATQKRLTDAVQGKLDATAKAHGYDSIISACSYASAPNTYQAEGQAFLAWRAACWDACIVVLTQVQAGQRAVPTEAELLAELPVLVLP